MKSYGGIGTYVRLGPQSAVPESPVVNRTSLSALGAGALVPRIALS